MFLYDTILFPRCTLWCHAIFNFYFFGRTSVYLYMPFFRGQWQIFYAFFIREYHVLLELHAVCCTVPM